MRENELLQSVKEARDQLAALRARLESGGKAPGSPEIARALGDPLEMLEKLQAHYGLLREILAQSSDAVFAKDLEGRYVLINPNGAGMFGKSVEEILGRDDTELFEPESAERIMAIDRTVMSTGKPRTFEETFGLRGVPITLLTTSTTWCDHEGKVRGLIGTAQDVTERNRLERGAEVQRDRLRSLASEIMFAEESLRQSLAADLHNGLGQDIALTKMKLTELRLASSPELHEPLLRIEHLVEQADRSLRFITFQLSPPTLHDLGLVPALQWLAEDIQSRYGLVVRLGSDDGMLRLRVEDSGRGFDAAKVSLQGYGLFGIREHLRQVGGSMEIDSVPDRGTTVSLSVPLAAVGSGTPTG